MVQKEPEPDPKPPGRPAGRPRGRPRGFEPSQALDQARRAFWDGGYAATSLDDLAEATGLARPSLYGAFGDKRTLYIQALDRSVAESVAAIRATFSPDLTVREGLGRVFAGSVAIYSAGANGARGCFITGTAVVESVADSEIRARVADALTRIEQTFEQRFALARERGEIAPHADPSALALMSSALLNALSIRARAGFPRERLDAAAAAGLAMICGGAGA